MGMLRTVWIIIGVFFAMLFVGLVLKQVMESTKESGLGSFNIHNISNGTHIVLSWETSEPADAFARYVINGTSYERADHQYKTTHRLVIPEADEYSIESCDLKGRCITRSLKSV
jgi:hypothetical protein